MESSKTTTKVNKNRTQKDYTIGFKLDIVMLVEKGNMTYKQAQRIYGIQSRSTVLVWLRKYGNLDWNKPRVTTMRNQEQKKHHHKK